MTGLPTPTLIFVVAGALALALEGVGARTGERKLIGRNHLATIVVVAAIVAVVAAALTAPATLWTTGALAAALIAWAACEPSPLGERAALALGLAGLCALFALDGTPTPLEALVCVVGSGIVIGAMAARHGSVDERESDPAVEASARQLFGAAVAAVLIGVGVIAGNAPIGAAALIIGLALAVGVPPLHGPRLDLAQGAPPGVAALAALPILALGPLTAELVVAAPPPVALVVCVVGGLGLPLVALGQVSMRRLLGVLAVIQPTLPVAAAVVGHDTAVASAVAAFATVGLAVAAWALPSVSRPLASWEDTSGAGRLMPWRAGLVVFVAAFACGLPPTVGFGLRRALAVAARDVVGPHAELATLLPLTLVWGGALAALPVVRLALFLFGKTPRAGTRTPSRTPAFLVLGGVVAFAVIVGVIGVGP